MSSEELITLDDAIIIRETDDAYLVDYEGTQGWIPKSKIDNLEEVNETYTNSGCGRVSVEEIVIPEWLAMDKEFI